MAPLSLASTQAIARLRAYIAPPTTWYSLPLSRRAAVLILLFADHHGDLKVVLTLRASTLSSYAGQVSFPGGKSDTLEETPIETARREALEEIGLPNDVHKLPAPFQVDHLCELPSNLALTELGVRPCVAFLHTGENPVDSEETLMPRLEPKEVSAIFFASLRSFLSDRDPRGRDAVTGSRWYQGREGTWFGTRGRVHQFNVPKKGGNASLPEDSYKVFGMTARMLIDTARLAYAEEPSFEYEHHLGDEEVLRKLLNSGRLSAEKQSGSHITREDVAKAAKM